MQTVTTPAFNTAAALSGRRFPTHRFQVQRAQHTVSADALHALLHGNAVALHVEGYLSAVQAEGLAAGFRETVRRQRQDAVPAVHIGDGHYAKTLAEYFRAAASGEAEMNAVYRRAGIDLAQRSGADLRALLDPGQALRPAMSGDWQAAELKAVAWIGKDGGLALSAHDDSAQLNSREQAGFEPQQVQHPVAVNIYAAMPKSGGELRVWNLQPSDACKRELGLEETGFPYPAPLLAALPFIDIASRPGDLVLLNGRFLHAVRGWDGAVGERIVYNGFIGLSRDGATVLRWT